MATSFEFQTNEVPLFEKSVENQVFTNKRLRLWLTGLCISLSQDKRLVAVYCDPNKSQTFSLSADGKLIFNENGYCVRNSASPKFQNCYNAWSLTANNSYQYLRSIERNTVVQCLTPASNKTGEEIKLMECDKGASRIELMEETAFQIDRQALRYNSSEQLEHASCKFALFHLNQRLPPVKLISPKPFQKCTNYVECVTVVTKTAKRPLLVIRMAKSIRDIKGYDLPIIVFDDGPDEYDEVVRQEIAQFPLLEYNIVDDDDDLGISLGRNLAVSRVKTKYSLFADDDTIITNKTILEKAVDILESTDASVVGGHFSYDKEFSGFMKFGVYGDANFTQLMHFEGSCSEENITIPSYPRCVICDLTDNMFLAKTKDILEVGGWSSELKVSEHKDIFLRLKAAGKKVVYCGDFQILNKRVEENSELNSKDYTYKRRTRFKEMRLLFKNRWNINRVLGVGLNQNA